MGQIANQMALELFFKIKERIKEKKSKNKPIKTMVQRNRQFTVEQNRCAMACQGCGAAFFFSIIK